MEEKTHSEYRHMMWELYPEGNYSSFCTCFNNLVGLNSYVEGELLTAKLIYEKYQKYHEWWIYTYGKRKIEFRGNAAVHITPEDYVGKGHYNTSKVIMASNPIRDIYIFGTATSKAKYHEQLTQFLQQINNNYVGKFKYKRPISKEQEDSPF